MELRVRYAVLGTVQIEGDRVNVAVALASTESGEEVWSEQYRRTLSELLVLQEEITALIVASLEAEMERKEMQRSLLVPSSDLDAWSLYHHGIHHSRTADWQYGKLTEFLEEHTGFTELLPRSAATHR